MIRLSLIFRPVTAFTALRLPKKIRVPISYIKGLGSKTNDTILAEFQKAPFESTLDFYRRVLPAPEDMELLIRAGAFDEFGKTRTEQFWECQFHQRAHSQASAADQGWLLNDEATHRMPESPLQEPSRKEKLESEAELFA